MPTIFLGRGVPELLATMWLRYNGVGGVYTFFGYIVFGQPLIAIVNLFAILDIFAKYELSAIVDRFVSLRLDRFTNLDLFPVPNLFAIIDLFTVFDRFTMFDLFSIKDLFAIVGTVTIDSISKAQTLKNNPPAGLILGKLFEK